MNALGELAIERRPIINRAEWLRWRREDVTASDIATLLADELHPYRSAFELWAIKSGKVEDAVVETAAMRRGRALEHLVLEIVAEDKPSWTVHPGDSYFRDPDARIGATPDAFATRPDIDGTGIVQAKTANENSMRRHWRNADGEVEPPLWVAVQATVEASLTGATWAAVAVLEMAQWEVHVLDVPLNLALMGKLRELVADFWARVESGDFYPPHYQHDAEVISRLFAEAEDREIDLRADNRILDLIASREQFKATEELGRVAEKARRVIDSEIVMKLGNAERGRLADGRVIHAPTIRRKEFVSKATSWRQIAVKEASRRLEQETDNIESASRA